MNNLADHDERQAPITADWLTEELGWVVEEEYIAVPIMFRPKEQRFYPMQVLYAMNHSKIAGGLKLYWGGRTLNINTRGELLDFLRFIGEKP